MIKGYLCEHCHQKAAKYEQRSLIEGKNHLVCFDCLQELSRWKKSSSSVAAKQTAVPWPPNQTTQHSVPSVRSIH